MNLCSIRLHKWDKWSEPRVTQVYTDQYCLSKEHVTVQERFCLKCNKMQVSATAVESPVCNQGEEGKESVD